MYPIFEEQHGTLQPVNKAMTTLDNSEGNQPGKVRKVYNTDGTPRWEVWLKNATGGALTKGKPYMVKVGSTKATILQCGAIPGAATTYYVQIVYPTTALADATWGWFVFAGFSDDIVLVKGTGVDAGRFLKVSAADASALLDDGTTRTANSVGVGLEVGVAGAAAKKVYLTGERVLVAA